MDVCDYHGFKGGKFIDAVINYHKRKNMEDYIHIYKIPRSHIQEAEESLDSRTESFLDNRKSRHDYEPVDFNKGESDGHQQPSQVEDLNTQDTEKKDIKQQTRKFFCIYSIIAIVAFTALMVSVAVSLTVIAIRSKAISDEVADLQQQLEEFQLVQVGGG
jgi:hypothetical protein